MSFFSCTFFHEEARPVPSVEPPKPFKLNTPTGAVDWSSFDDPRIVQHDRMMICKAEKDEKKAMINAAELEHFKNLK